MVAPTEVYYRSFKSQHCHHGHKNISSRTRFMKASKLHYKVNHAITVGNINDFSMFDCGQVTIAIPLQALTCSHILITSFTILVVWFLMSPMRAYDDLIWPLKTLGKSRIHF
jgi:hypothetical protein